MFSSWEFLAGKKLAEYSRISDLQHHTLIVEVDHPAIMQMLQMKYSEILGKLSRKYPELEVQEVRMFLRNPEFKNGHARDTENLPGDNDENSQREEKKVNLNSIEDEKFRDLLLNMKKRSQL